MRAAGPAHPRVRQYLNVKHNRGTHPAGAIALEGLWAVRHAVAAGLEIEALFVCDTLNRGADGRRVAEEFDGVAFAVSERVLRRMVDRDGPDGVAAIAYLRTVPLQDIDTRANARVVVVDACELAGNLGAIVRCADGAGADAVIVTDRRVRITNPLVVKASMGTLFTLPVVDASRAEALTWLRGHGFRIVAADPTATTSYRRADYGGRVALVLGSERYGLASFWAEAADVLVSIPMLGVADSLNVGHAAALLLYEALATLK